MNTSLQSAFIKGIFLPYSYSHQVKRNKSTFIDNFHHSYFHYINCMSTHIKWTLNIWNIFVNYNFICCYCCCCCDRERVKNSMTEKCVSIQCYCVCICKAGGRIYARFFFFTLFMLLHMFYNRIQIASGIYCHLYTVYVCVL